LGPLREYLVDLHSRFPFLLAPAVMAPVIIPVLLATAHGGSQRSGAAVTFLLPICYRGIQADTWSFAKAHLLPPLLGIWAANIVVGGHDVALYLRTPT
jgi:lipopolysaccharide export LptBFGC system permease protein LptF